MSWLKLLLGLVALVRQVTTLLHDKRLLDAGAAEQVAKSLVEANKSIEVALAAGRAADERHKQDKTDAAFNSKYQRKDE